VAISMETHHTEEVGGNWVGGIQIRIEEGRASIVAREWKADEPIPTALEDPLYQVAVSAVGEIGRVYRLGASDLEPVAAFAEPLVARIIAGTSPDVDPGAPLEAERDLTPDARRALAELQHFMAGPVAWTQLTRGGW
jgi:hypothetical protein